jgi:hypothetical protein
VATFTCDIGGSTRPTIVQGFTIRETSDGVDVLDCEVRSLDGVYKPSINDDLFFFDGSTRLFGGKVETVSTRGANDRGNTDGLILAITAKSYSILAQRRIITITLAAGTLKAQLTQLNTAAFATDFGTAIHASQHDGPTMPEIVFTDARTDEILEVMMKTAISISGNGWTWKIDENNDLRAVFTGEIAAPFDVVDGDGNAILDITLEETRNDLYANRLLALVESGPATSQESFVAADGVTAGDIITFTAQFPASQSITDAYPNVLRIDGVVQSVIGFGVDQLPAGDWYWDYTTSPATLKYPISGGRPFPTGAEVITIEYAIRYPITKIVEDAAGISAYGRWERKVRTPTALGDEALQAYAEGVLASLSPVRKEVRYPTRQTGVRPGMTQLVDSAKRKVDATVLVQEVTTEMLTDTEAVREVSAVISDVFQGTYRGTVEQWMRTGGGGAAVETTGVSGGAAHPPEGAVQFNRSGAFYGKPTFRFLDRSDTAVVGNDHDVSAVFVSDCGDTYPSLSEWDIVAPLMIAVAGTGEDGTSGARWNSADATYAGASLLKAIDATNRVRVRWSQFIPAGALPLSGFTWYTVAAFHYANGGSFTNSTKQVSINTTVDGEFFFVRGNYNETTIAGPTAAVVFAENAWNHIEVDVTIHDTTGRVRLWHNDDLVLDADGLDTQDLGSALIDGVEIGQQRVAGATATLDNVDIDVARRNIVTGKGHEVHSSDGLIAGRNNVARGAVVEARGRDMTVDAESSIGINLTDTPRTLTTPNTHAIWADSFQVNGNEISAALNKRVFGWVFDGGGSVLTTGAKSGAAWRAPVAGTITKVTLLSDQDGAIVIDICKDTLANYPPTNADSITASAPPTITSSNDSSEDATLTGWTTAFATGDIFLPNIDSVTSIERCTLLAEYEVT